ncbi:sorting nexin-8 isoform X2 [Leguminivora glycinivorella]|uniref:sorting nexin-8 isoform X2 n=1 Tax=Leguminivora glycinivorella TaxID=1035111 RepID=UPI00200BAB9D|nr:sorting nexin-8 isoform X2 [Leguminivora glycinivorella]
MQVYFSIVFGIVVLAEIIEDKTAVLILARGGSKGIRLKNLQQVNNSSLLNRAIHTAKIAGIRDVIVSTDHPLIALESFKITTMSNPEIITFEDLEATDVISVELVPERKGLILKHCEYYVSSRRHGTTVTRRYNEFVQLYDVLYAKYPYRAVCRLPPKRVVVNGGSPLFLQRRRAALQRWLTLMARHPVLAHDADLRTFLCEANSRLEKPKHDEFTLAGTQESSSRDMTTEEMQAAFVSSQEQLRLVQLGLDRLFQIFERAESRCEAEKADIRELGAGLNALSATNVSDAARWSPVREALKVAAELAVEMGENATENTDFTEDGIGGRLLLALDALGAYRELCGRLTRGLHAERAAAAAQHKHSAASQLLRERHRYALCCATQEALLSRAYALAAVESLPSLFRTQGATHARVATLWADLHTALRHAAKPK